MEKRRVGQTDLWIDTLGVGGAPLGGNFVKLTDEDASHLIQTAREAGLSYFDTAPWYGFGRSERVIGDAARGSDYVLSDKVGRLLKPGAMDDPMEFGMIDPLPFNVVYDYGYDGIMRAYEDNLQRLGLERIDMLLVHDIGVMQHGEDNAKHFADLENGGYRALEELRGAGDVTAIGIGVNETAACLDALGIGTWDVFLLAGRYTLLEQTALDDLFPACDAAGTTIICGGPFNSGILAGRDMWNYSKAPEAVVEKVRKISDVADGHGVPLAAAALQFPLGSETVTSVIPGPRNTAELSQIVEWFSTPVPKAFWDDLRAENLILQAAPTPSGV